MRELELERTAYRRLALKSLGTDPVDRHPPLSGLGRSKFSEQAIMRLPVISTDWKPIQKAYGSLVFVAGFSRAGIDPV